MQVLVIAVLLKFIMRRRFSIIQVSFKSMVKVMIVSRTEQKILYSLYKFDIIITVLIMLQLEALALLLIGVSINQLQSHPEGTTSFGLPVTAIAYIYTLISVSNSMPLFLTNNCDVFNLRYFSKHLDSA